MEAKPPPNWPKCAIAWLLLVFGSTALFWGCAPRWSTAQLARQIAPTDHIVIYEWNHGCLLNLSGREASDLVRAVCRAEGSRKDEMAATAPCCELEFFQGTNRLASIRIQEEWFGCESGEFLDRSGQLQALQRRIETDAEGSRAWTRYLAGQVLKWPGFTNLQPWGMATLQRYTAGQGPAAEDIQLDHDFPPGLEQSVQQSTHLAVLPSLLVHRGGSGQPSYVVVNWWDYALVVGPTNGFSPVPEWYSTNFAPGLWACHAELVK